MKLAALALDPRRRDPRHRCQRAAEASAALPRRGADAAHAPVMFGQEGHDEIRFAELARAQHVRFVTTLPPRKQPDHSEARQFPEDPRVVAPVGADLDAQREEDPALKSRSMSARASLPTSFEDAAPFPITIPFCESRSTKIVASISTRPSARSDPALDRHRGGMRDLSRIRWRIFSRTHSAASDAHGLVGQEVFRKQRSALRGGGATRASTSSSQPLARRRGHRDRLRETPLIHHGPHQVDQSRLRAGRGRSC